MTVARTFVEWGLGISAVPDEVRRSARRHILDAAGTAIAARRLGTVNHVIEEARSYLAPAESSIFGGGARVPGPMAALANGALIHALDFDDTHARALVHGTAVTLPAALAATETSDGSFSQAVDSLVVGLEVALRIGRAAPHGFHSRGFHATPVAGVFGAVLAAARAAGVNVDVATNAMGIAGSTAAGSLEFLSTGSSTKQIHPGWAGLSALTSVRLAQRGATGPETILEGENGFYRSYANINLADPASLLSDLGTVWESTRMTIKPYPLCQLSHATLDAVSQLRGSVDPNAIVGIDVQLPSESVPIVAAPIGEKTRPRSAYEAKFALQWEVAALILDGGVTIDSFSSDQLSRKELNELAKTVNVTPYEFDGAPADAPGRVSVTDRGGIVRSASVKASSGSPESPLSDEALISKFEDNVSSVITNPSKVASMILGGHLDDISDLFGILEMK